MSGSTDFEVARIYLRPQRQLPLVSTAVAGFAQRQQRVESTSSIRRRQWLQSVYSSP